MSRSAPPDTKIFYSLVGLHAVTLPKDPQKLERERREMLAALAAMGLGGLGGREVVFCQDMVRFDVIERLRGKALIRWLSR